VKLRAWIGPTRVCGFHQDKPCDCEAFSKHDLWELYDTNRKRVGFVQRLSENGQFYGNADAGRTGAVDDLYRCQVMVEQMVTKK
jgi:hypothetical protein